MYWESVSAFFKDFPLTKQHIDSYNEFMNRKIQGVVDEVGIIETHKENCYIKLGKIRMEKPVVTEADGSRRQVLPMEAILRNRTYAAPVFLEMTLIDQGVETDKDEVCIGEIPVMLKSDLCYLRDMNEDDLMKAGQDPDDPGGYFIINGSERVLVSVEDLAPNRVIVSKEPKGGRNIIVGRVFSTKGGFRAKIGVERNHDGTVFINFPASPKNLNLFIALKALGLDSKSELLSAFSETPQVQNEVLLNLESIDVRSREDAVDYLGKRVAACQPEEYRKTRAEQVLDQYLLPHIGTTREERMKKAYFLVRMVERIIEVAHDLRKEDDKDHYANKRIKISGNLVEDLFRYAFGYFQKDLKYQVERAYARGRKLQLRTLVRQDALSDRIKFSMATGNWVGGRTGISQLLDRFSFIATMSHLRRLISPLSKTHPHFEARDLHPTHFGKVCPNETPEGQSCGLVKNFATGCLVSAREIDGLEKSLASLGVGVIKK